MLTLLRENGIGVPLNVDDYYVREVDTGLDEVIFDLSIWDPLFPEIQEETLLREQSDGQTAEYRVKAINSSNDRATIKAQLQLDDWEASCRTDYEFNGNFYDFVNAIKPSGWTVTASEPIMRTAKIEADGTPLAILQDGRAEYDGVAYRFNQQQKIIQLVDMYNLAYLGSFLTRDLNLKAVKYTGKSTKLVTRLYPYGKADDDGHPLTIASVNNGKPYVENHTYTDRVICATMTDDRFTDAANLKEYAQARLDEQAVPERSFDCDVVDLMATNPGKYDYLSFELFSKIGLIDETRQSGKIMHRVVERWRYPFHPEKNKVILSNSPRKLQVQVKEALQPAKEERISKGAVGGSRLMNKSVGENKIDEYAVSKGKLKQTLSKQIDDNTENAKKANDFLDALQSGDESLSLSGLKLNGHDILIGTPVTIDGNLYRLVIWSN